MSAPTRVCPACGAEGEGNFCAKCGEAMPQAGAAGGFCPRCGAAREAGALYCSECGAPVAPRPSKSLRDRLPWILSGLALVAFAVAITLMIGESTGERAEGMPPTGAVIPSPGAGGAGAAAGGGMSAGGVDLASMSPRERADRLFDRAMRTEASGDTTQARFFARMGVQAYGMVPPADIDADARFHVGVLELMQGNPGAARQSADAILASNPDHLLAWILRGQIAEAQGDQAALAEARRNFNGALASERGAGRPEYEQHAALIDQQAEEFGASP